MKSILSIVVFALYFLSISGLDQKGWIVSVWNNTERLPSDLLVREFEVYGFFLDVVLITGTDVEVQKLQDLGFRSKLVKEYVQSEQLWAVEFGKLVRDDVKRDFERTSIKENFVFGLFEEGVIVVSSPDFLEDNTFYWAVKTESIRLPSKPFTPGPKFEDSPIYDKLVKIEKNAIIENLISQVSENEMLPILETLTENFFTRISGSDGLVEARDYIIGLFEDMGLNVTTHSYTTYIAENICADLVGKTFPERLVIAGAHYDSRSTSSTSPDLRAPGAVDNGSGTVGMIEMARVLSQSQVEFENTIRICVWTGEEQGLLGSDAYATKMKRENANILAYFNADMTGYKLPGSKITLGMKDRSVTQWLLDLSFTITQTYVPTLPAAESSSCCSDYISFFDEGYPSIGYFQNPGAASDYPAYHTSDDTMEHMNWEQTRLETQAVMAALLTFAVPLE